jgi:hypothetical protein
MTPVFERAKTLHALDRAVTVTGFVESFVVETAVTCMYCDMRPDYYKSFTNIINYTTINIHKN